MALPFIVSSSTKKRDQIVAVDLGGRTTKAVQLQRHGEVFTLSRVAVLDAPIFEKSLPVDVLSEHLRSITTNLDARTKQVSITTNVNEAMVRPVEMPAMPVDDMRQMLKHSSKTYLQQELPNHVFDCHAFTPLSAEAAKGAGPAKQKVLVAAGKQDLVNDFVEATKTAGLTAECIIPGLIGPVNAFEFACPDAFHNGVVALVDIGFKSSSICILQRGELILTRVVTLGGDRITQGLADSLGTSYAEAEGIKIGMPGEVQDVLESIVTPLGRELRASIDFFEHQQDQPVSAAYLTGGTTRSELIVQNLQQELMIEAKAWNPTSFLKNELPSEQAAEIEQLAPQLAVAVGAGLAAL